MVIKSIIVNDRTYHKDLELYGTIINIQKETIGLQKQFTKVLKKSNYLDNS